MQPQPTAPDISPLDSAICPFTERVVEVEGALTAEDIHKAVRKAWKKVTPEICKKACLRVRRNMKEVIRLNGGNFYIE